jgi:hypothetical protein
MNVSGATVVLVPLALGCSIAAARGLVGPWTTRIVQLLLFYLLIRGRLG